MQSATDASPDGACQVCGAPGRLQHAPPPAPVSGLWCERCYGKLERRGRWLHAVYRYRLLVFFGGVTLWLLVQQVMAQELTQAAQCVVGSRVPNRDGPAGSRLPRNFFPDRGCCLPQASAG